MDAKEVRIFASKVFYLANDTIESEKLKRHEIAGVLRKLADYQEEIPCLEILTREELKRVEDNA